MEEQPGDQQDIAAPVRRRGRRWWPAYSGLGLVATLLLVFFLFGGDIHFQYNGRSLFPFLATMLMVAFLIGTAPGFGLVMVDRRKTWWRFLLLVIGILAWVLFCAIGTFLLAYGMSPVLD